VTRILDRKLWRDLRTLKGSFGAIMLIVACGVASFGTVLTAYRGLKASRDTYYARYRMADAFAPVKKAPRHVVRSLESVPGVRRVQGRIVFDVTLDLPELELPVSGRAVSVPDRRRRILCDLHLTAGAWFEDDGTREVIVAQRFAEMHGIGVGDELRVIMNNKKEALRIVGLALSPEFIYLIGGDAILPDAEHFTVLWLSESFAEAVFDFEDSCNDVLATIDRDAETEEVLAAFDRQLDRYGAVGAYARENPLSHRYVDDEIEGLKGSATFVPAVFLGVAAFVLVKVYRDFYDFPLLDFSVDPVAVGVGAAVGLGFVALGAFRAVRAAAALLPAEGLRPAAPQVYHRILLERARGFWRMLGFSGRMVVRHLSRTKLRMALAVTGLAMGTAVLMLSLFGMDSTAKLMDVQFRLVERQDARIAFHNEHGDAALYELRRLEGVRHAEPELSVGVRLRHDHREKRTAVTGLDRGGTLHGLLDRELRPVPLPRDGLLLSRKLAEILRVRAGDELEVEVLYGEKQQFRAPVESVVDEYLGAYAYAERGRLSRWIGEESALTGALLSIDPRHEAEVGRRLKELPAVSSVGFRDRVVASFDRTIVDVATIGRGPIRSFVEEEAETQVVERFVVSAPTSTRSRSGRTS